MKSAAKVAALGIGLGLAAAGCGSGTVIVGMISPTITQVSPQVVTAGTPSVTVTVQGSNFQSQASVTVNGSAMPTTVVNSTTLAAKISGSTLAQPAVAHLQVKNTDGASSNEVPLTVTSASQNATLAISTSGLPGAQSGTAYSSALTASGGTPAYSWSISSGSLPAGLSLSSNGAILGTPTGSGTFTFGVTVSDSSSPAQSQTVTLSIVVLPATPAPPALSITSAALGSGQVGSAYSASLSATGGTPSYSWSLSSGSLPAGLTLSNGGVISGTPTASGTSTFTVALKDSGSPAQSASGQVSITVAPAGLSVHSVSLGAGVEGSSYSTTLTATGGTPGYAWSLASGSLPAGLTLSPSGIISGTPTASGTATFTVRVSDSGSPAQTASAQESLTIAAANLAVTSTSLSSGKEGSSYSTTLSASGGTPGYTWSLASGSLPAGLTLSNAGVISGTPTGSGTATFTVAVADSGSPQQTASIQESLTIAAPGLTITSTNLAAGTTGSSYNVSLSANGGTPGYTWSISSGNLPAGLTISSSGVISGAPTASGSSNFVVSVADSSSPAQTATMSESITVSSSQLVITTTSLAGAQASAVYSANLSASGGTPNYTWTLSSGSLPAGLTLSSSGMISGTPTTAGASNFTVAVSDNSSPVQSASLPLSIAVSAAQSSNSGTTWYVRPDGGTRYSSSFTSGQCDGKGDQSYAAAVAANGGTAAPNLHCAFNEVQYLWQDGTSAGDENYGWIIAGGDTVIIRGSIADGVSYRIGWPNGSSNCASGGFPCFGYPLAAGGAPYSGAPAGFPGGSPGRPTRILGGNYGACTAQSARTQLHGGYGGVNNVLDFSGAAYIDVECLDITDFSGCGTIGQTPPCNGTTTPYDDYAKDGIRLSNAITNSTFTDIRIHGLGAVGMVGPVGDNVTFTDLAIIGNAGAGWNADDGTTGLGSMLMQNFNISWNGCAEEYPIVDALPYNQCTDDLSGGYGDGFGTATAYTLQNATAGTAWAGYQIPSPGGTTPPDRYTLTSGSLPPGISMNSTGFISGTPTTAGIYDFNIEVQPASGGGVYNSGFQIAVGTSTLTYSQGWQIKFEQGVVTYNTQDGLDALHTLGVGMTSSFDRILAYGNMGNQIKSGSSNGSAITNSVIFANCDAMSLSISGTPSGYNSRLSDFCRANDEAVIISTAIGAISYFAGNTVYGSRAGTTINNWGDLGGITCTSYSSIFNVDGTGPQCDSTTSLIYTDNILVGFDPLLTGLYPAQYYLQDGAFATSVFTNPGSMYRNNLKYNVRTPCPDVGETNSICAAPQLINVTWPAYGYVDVQPTPGSSNVVGAGILLPAVTQDYTGTNRGDPPSIGAYE